MSFQLGAGQGAAYPKILLQLSSASLCPEQRSSQHHHLTPFTVLPTIIWEFRTSGQELLGVVPCRNTGFCEEHASCLHEERPRGQRKGKSFLCKGKKKSQTLEERWAGTYPHSPAVPMHGKSSGQRAQHPSVEPHFEARWLLHLVVVAGKMFLSLQCGRYLASGSVHLGKHFPSVTLKPPWDEAVTVLLCTKVTATASLSTTTSGPRFVLTDTPFVVSLPCHGSWVAEVPESL